MKAQRGTRGIALFFFNLGCSWGWVVNSTPWPLYTREMDPVPIAREAGWAPGPVWTGLCADYAFPAHTVRYTVDAATEWC